MFCNCEFVEKNASKQTFVKCSAKILLTHSKKREKYSEEKRYRAHPKGTAVQMFLFNSCTIVLKRVHPGHVDLSH